MNIIHNVYIYAHARSISINNVNFYAAFKYIFSPGARGIAGLSSGANGGGSNAGKVAGGVIGGLVCLALLSAIVIVCLWFGRKKIAEQKAFRGKQNYCHSVLCKNLAMGFTLKLESKNKMMPVKLW